MNYFPICALVILQTFRFTTLFGQVPADAHILFPDDEILEPKLRVVPMGTRHNQVNLERQYANGIQNISEFASFFNLDLPEDAADYDEYSSVALRFGPALGIAEEFSQANCAPEMKTLILPLVDEPGVSYFPTCIRIEQCGGCCVLPDMSCQPVSVQDVEVKVLRVQENEPFRAPSPGSRRKRSETQYVPVLVERHVQCECQCIMQAEDCDSQIQNYDQNKCACVCNDANAERSCIQNTNRRWDSKTCQCRCKEPLICSTGKHFNEGNCRCQ